MGEVGTNSADDPHVDLKMNGGINGNCEDEVMDVDAQNDSQNTNEAVAKKVDNDSVSVSNDDKIPDTTTTTNDKSNAVQSSDDDDDDDDEEEEEEGEVNIKKKMEIDTDNDKNASLLHENGSSVAVKASDDNIDLSKSSESDSTTENPIETNRNVDKSEKINDDKTIESANLAGNSGDPITKCTESTENGTSARKTVDDSNLLKPINDDEVHAISDSDDDDVGDNIQINPLNMDVDNNSQSNGVNNKIVLDDDDDDDDDDDKPVSIHSDSDSEPETDGKDEVHEILSDKEDCVVIEDDKRLDGNDLTVRPINRARKSAIRPRDFSEFDDDIEEIIEDPLEQSVPKKPRLNDPLKMGDESQQFHQSNKSKEPTLVIIDTNTILSRGSATNAQIANKTTSPSLLSNAGQSYSIDSRTSITPVPNNNQTTSIIPATASTIGNVTSTTLAGLNAPVLTALTDDMFVLEAPSFIVPYIYEKPPGTDLKEIVTEMAIEIEEQKKLEEIEKKENKKEKEKIDGNSEDAKEMEKSDEDEEKKPVKKRKPVKNADDSWDESDVSTDDDASDVEETKVLIKEAKADLDTIKTHIINRDITKDSVTSDDKKDSNNYFDSPLGKFFMDIGINLVQEHVQTDLLRQQKRKLNREGNQASPDVQLAINSLMKNLECSKGKNDPFKFETKRCEYCNFKSESSLVMAHHYETPHMKGNLYKCNFCAYEIKPPYEILLHMKTVHNIQARLEKALSYHQCPNCLFEDNGRSKLARHAVVCSKKFRPEVNLAPPVDWDPPAKIPRIKPRHGLVGTANAYQAMAAQAQRAATAAAIQRQNAANAAAMKNRGRPQTVSKTMQTTNNNMRPQQQAIRPQVAGGIVLPNNFQMTNPGQFIQVPGTGIALLPNVQNSFNLMQATGSKSQKNSQQPSISITALPRQTQPNANPSTNLSSASNAMQQQQQQQQAAILPKPLGAGNVKPGQTQSGGKASFVICEICDGWIKDLDQLRNHMQWMHKVKIHPKMIYNRPPLNCQKCQFRFFTDQGLERHLLGSHGLVTSSMQEAANKGKDAGRCPVCGRMYQWKLLNHVSREHGMTLKPAHLSYKCTVCTATFGMYKQFENHVYSAHSTVAKRSSEGKTKLSSSSSSSSSVGNSSRSGLAGMVSAAGASILKQPFKINDEITITPQPAARSNRPIEIESHVID